MEIFIDSASIVEIEKWHKMGVIDGVTTNPSIVLKDGFYDVEKGAREIASLVSPSSVSVEVTTNNLEQMVTQARQFSAWAPNITIKIPQTNQDGVPCYGVINQLESEGIRVNATVALSLGQVILSAKAGATYISIFAGRIGDEGGNPSEIIMNSAAWLEQWEYRSKIIVGSIRTVGDILNAAVAGAHVITIPPQLIARMVDHKYTRETVRQFIEDAEKSLKKMHPES